MLNKLQLSVIWHKTCGQRWMARLQVILQSTFCGVQDVERLQDKNVGFITNLLGGGCKSRPNFSSEVSWPRSFCAYFATKLAKPQNVMPHIFLAIKLAWRTFATLGQGLAWGGSRESSPQSAVNICQHEHGTNMMRMTGASRSGKKKTWNIGILLSWLFYSDPHIFQTRPDCQPQRAICASKRTSFDSKCQVPINVPSVIGCTDGLTSEKDCCCASLLVQLKGQWILENIFASRVASGTCMIPASFFARTWALSPDGAKELSNRCCQRVCTNPKIAKLATRFGKPLGSAPASIRKWKL